jgi:hypothetical protein
MPNKHHTAIRTPGALYVLKNYKLEATATGFKATNLQGGYSAPAVFEGADRAEVIHRARCHWGHFNHQDEADAFGEVFR